MQDREKKLAIGLTLVVGIWLGRPAVDRWFVAPVREARDAQNRALAQFRVKSDDELKLLVAQQNLADWRSQSLPPDPSTAQRVYKDWLMDLAELSGFTTPEPTLPSIGTRGRGAAYTQIPVGLEAKATFEQLATFLVHFHRANLLQRIDSLDIVSPRAEGQSILNVVLSARGIALSDVPDRQRLFPRALVAEPVTGGATTLEVKDAETFPKGEFLVMVDRELMRVIRTAGNTWTIERGAERTLPANHSADAAVDLYPVRPSGESFAASLADFRELLEGNPFTIPAPPVQYNPKLVPDREQVVTRGMPWTTTVAVSNWDPSGGPPRYSIEGDIPPGMTLDPNTGEWKWAPNGEDAIGTHEVTIRAESPVIASQRVSVIVPVKLREPNLPPKVEDVAPQTAYSGQPLVIDIPASDPDGDTSKLQFKLTETVPDKATISESGRIEWTPPVELNLGDYQFTVEITDSGDPAQAVTAKVPVKLAEDEARLTYLTTFFQAGDQPIAQLHNRATDKSSTLKIGSSVKAADIEAEVTRIEPQFILLKIGSETFRLEMGHNLRALQPADPAEPATARDSTASAR